MRQRWNIQKSSAYTFFSLCLDQQRQSYIIMTTSDSGPFLYTPFFCPAAISFNIRKIPLFSSFSPVNQRHQSHTEAPVTCYVLPSFFFFYRPTKMPVARCLLFSPRFPPARELIAALNKVTNEPTVRALERANKLRIAPAANFSSEKVSVPSNSPLQKCAWPAVSWGTSQQATVSLCKLPKYNLYFPYLARVMPLGSPFNREKADF